MKEPILFVEWSEFLHWLLDCSEKFPRKSRFTFASRIDNIALEILEDIVEARYTPAKEKQQILKKININLEKLRVLLRICWQRKYLSNKSLEYAIRHLEKCGNMVGGWLKERK